MKKYEQTIAISGENLYNCYNHRNGVMGEVPPFTGFWAFLTEVIHVLR